MPARKIPRSYRSETGQFPSIKNNRSVEFESTLERDFYLRQEFEDDVESYEEQPLRISKKAGRRTICHYPDCRVRFFEKVGRKPLFVEVKYKSDLESKKEQLAEKFDMTREFSKENGSDFTVMTEDDIRGVYLENLKFIYKYARSYPAFERHREFILQSSRVDGPLKVSEFLDVLTPDKRRQAELLPAIWHMVFTKEIALDFNEKVTMNSIIEVRADHI